MRELVARVFGVLLVGASYLSAWLLWTILILSLIPVTVLAAGIIIIYECLSR